MIEKAMRDKAGKKNMGKLDIKDRLFFSDAERFAELINQNIYHGEKILLSENLISLKRLYPFLAKERDVLMKDQEKSICYGMEIETESDYSMPERVMAYYIWGKGTGKDAVGFHRCSGIQMEKEAYPQHVFRITLSL